MRRVSLGGLLPDDDSPTRSDGDDRLRPDGARPGHAAEPAFRGRRTPHAPRRRPRVGMSVVHLARDRRGLAGSVSLGPSQDRGCAARPALTAFGLLGWARLAATGARLRARGGHPGTA